MNIVYSSSDSYAEILGTSIISLYENNKHVEEINLFIINNGIGKKNKENIMLIAQKYKRKITFVECVDIEKLSGTKINVGRWHISTFYRLFLGSILPSNVEKVIYIDCDTIVRQSLAEVWKMNMNGMWVMGVDDCRSALYRIDIGLHKNNIYINNGFLLIDLKAWRKNNIEKKYLDFIYRYNGDITYMDQGVLNGVLGKLKKVGLLPLKYNAQTVFYDFNYEQIDKYRKPIFAYPRENFKNDIKNPIIVHYTTCFISGTRPWNKNNNHEYRGEFLMYRSLTPWGNNELREDNSKSSKKLMTKVTNILPLTIVLAMISVVHSKLYPMMRILKNRLNSRWWRNGSYENING